MASARERHPQIYVERNEDPRTRQRTVPMEVLSMGYSRTGTMTMKAALEILGLPTWHWVTMAENPQDMALWAEAIEAKFNPTSGKKPFGRREFDNLLGYWSACTDQPAALFSEELVQAYPDAKVVLCERDTERWYGSYTKTVIDGSANPFVPLAALVDPGFLGQMSLQTNQIARYVFGVSHTKGTEAFFDRKPFFDQWKRNAKSTYRAHNEHVKRVTPADRLLLFSLADGWGPLCQFLDKPVPDVPFPRVNETLAVQEKIKLYIAESYKRTLIRFARRLVPLVVLMLAVMLVWAWW
ncbi:hypothetical protein LTR10_000497 [Elasticomyces elasticus]|nr:hypothetical protein LTR10_000497 [Elasticomyces elasticus]KAK4980254.1 hypothetical protein LTR42_000561 [Elasticomyces elasticus]